MVDPNDSQQVQTLTDHLSELRDRLIRAAWAVALTTIVCWFFADRLLQVMAAPVTPFLPGGKLVFLNPVDMFVAHMKIALMGGIVIACPVWLYQAWMFVAPGLYARERRYTLLFILAGTGLFVFGAAFAHFLVLPTALQFLLTFGSSTGQAMITLPEYLSFFMTMILVFGAAFELPLIIVVLGALGLVQQTFLREKRRYAIVLMAFIAAVITPPDLLSMLMLLVPLCLLYEVSIVLVGIIARKRSELSAP
jgi:sec-independent protein translocase protein TatC